MIFAYESDTGRVVWEYYGAERPVSTAYADKKGVTVAETDFSAEDKKTAIGNSSKEPPLWLHYDADTDTIEVRSDA